MRPTRPQAIEDVMDCPHLEPTRPNQNGAARGRRGNYALLVGLSATTVLGMGALAIDSAYVRFVEAQAQAISDSAAHAALIRLRMTGEVDDARGTAEAFVNAHHLVGETARVDPDQDIVFGGWDFEKGLFDPDSEFINSVQVTLRKSSDSVNGSFSTLLMWMYGAEHQNAEASSPAIGAMRYREIVIVQDVTGSFLDEIELARAADLEFLNAIAEDAYPGDQLGMVTFVGDATVYTDMRYVSEDYSYIKEQWSQLDWCDRSYYPYTLYGPPVYHEAPKMMTCNYGTTYYLSEYDSGTSQGAGIDEAVDMLTTSSIGNPFSTKVIILISDGYPQCVYTASDSALQEACEADREQYAYDAADWAAENNIHIFSVSYNETADATQSAVMEALVRGKGRFYETPDPSELPAILDEIAQTIPIALVQ